MKFFLGNKKRDLSDKSRNGEDAKKVKKNNESAGSLSDEIFSDGLSSSECAKILVNCLRNIENQVKELFVLNEETKNAQIKVTESLEFFSNKFDELERENKKKNEKIKELEETIDILTEKNKSLTSDVDELEQYSRRNCLLLHGVQENENENTDDIVLKTMSEELDIEIKENDLDRTHRIGNRNRKDGKPRAIIVKFTCYATRNKIYSNKKKLKGKKFLITESLTSRRYHLLKEAQEKYGVKNVWTSDGRILFKQNNRILIYKSS